MKRTAADCYATAVDWRTACRIALDYPDGPNYFKTGVFQAFLQYSDKLAYRLHS